ncbi:unnamed protein product, partial [Schistosoma turkestanicum]
MNTTPVQLSDRTATENEKNEHFMHAFHCFFELFSKPTFINRNQMMCNIKYLSKCDSKSSFCQSPISNNINDDCKLSDTTDNTTFKNNETTNLNTDYDNNNNNNSNNINQGNSSICKDRHQSSVLTGFQQGFTNPFIIPQYPSIKNCQKFVDTVNMDENTCEIPLDLSMPSTVHKPVTQSTNTSTRSTTLYNHKSNDEQWTFCQLNCEYTQGNDRISNNIHNNDSFNQLHSSCEFNTKNKKCCKRFMSEKDTCMSAAAVADDVDRIGNVKNHWKRNHFTDIDINQRMAYFIQWNRQSNQLEQSSTVTSSSTLTTTTTTTTRSIPKVNYTECSPSGKQPVTRCNHCHVVFSSLNELNNHFLTEHNVILQAEMEHTKSWKSHTIDDSCLK